MKWYWITLIIASLIGCFVVAHFVQNNYIETYSPAGRLNSIYRGAEDPIPYNSTYSKYGYYPDKREFIAYDGLRYQYRDNGGVRVKDQAGRTQLVYGFGMSGNANGSFVKTEEDFEWVWEHNTYQELFVKLEQNSTDDWNNITYTMTVHNFTGTAINENFVWKVEYKFTPKDPAKITNYVTNNWKNITNGKFWYIMKDTGMIRYNGQVYDTSNTEINQQGAFNNKIPFVEFPDGGFDYEDLLNDNFDLVHIYIGNGSLLGYPNKRVMGLGFTKGSGNFNVGQSITLDPASTGFTGPIGHSDPVNQWNNPDRLLVSDDSRADEITSGHNTTVDFADFGLDPEANITGFEIEFEGTTDVVFTCPPKSSGSLEGFVSINNFTTDSGGSDRASFPCLILPSDSIEVIGGEYDMFGINSGGDINGSQITADDFRVKMMLWGSSLQMYVDRIRVNIYWTLPAPVLTALDPTPPTHSEVSSTVIINMSSDIELNTAVLQTNVTGVITNYTMSLYNNSMNALIILDGEDLGLDNGLDVTQGGLNNWTYQVIAESGGELGQFTGYNISVVSELPNATLNTPENGSTQTDGTVYFNVTNTDVDNDYVDMYFIANYNGSLNNRNYFYYENRVLNQTDATYNLTQGTLDATELDLFRYFKMDGLSVFGENSSATATNLRGFDNNFSIYREGQNTHTPDFVTADCLTQGCLDFDGTNDNILLDEGNSSVWFDLLNNSQETGFTFGGWINRDSSATQYIIAKDYNVGERYFAWTSDTFLLFNSTGDLVCSASLSGVTQNVWYHFVVVFNGTGYDLYKDGEYIEHDACTGEFDFVDIDRWNDNADSLEVYMGGSGPTGVNSELDGTLDEIFVYNRTLNSSEVADIYNTNNSRSSWDWNLRMYQSPNDIMDLNYTFDTVVEAAVSCNIDCTVTNLISGTLDCLGEGLVFSGLDASTDRVEIDSAASIINFPWTSVQDCTVGNYGRIFG